MGNSELIKCSRSSPSWLAGLPTQDYDTGVTRSVTSQASFFLAPLTGNKKGAWELGLYQLGFRPTSIIPWWKTHACILFQVCDVQGGLGLNQSTITPCSLLYFQLREQAKYTHVVVNACSADRVSSRLGYSFNITLARRFRCEDNNTYIMRVMCGT